MAFQFRIYYNICLKQFRSKEIGAVEPTTRHATRMEAQAYATAERRRQVEFGAGLRQRRLLGRLSFPLFVVTLEWTNSTGGFVLRAQASIRCLGTERHLMPLLHRGNSEVSHPFFEGVDLGLIFTPPQSGDAVLVIAEVVAGGYTDASACEILWPGRKHGASGIGGQRRSRRS